MKLIKQSVELIPQNNLFEHIERCARVCYKSEDKQSEHPAKFVNKLITNKHFAMLEHGTIYTKKEVWSLLQAQEIIEKFGKYSNYNLIDGVLYITTNMRVIKENRLENRLENWFDYICKPTEFNERRYTIKIITSIGIVRELLRHRKFSFANESTRYCNYSKDKFDNELTFIKPSWFDRQVGITNYGKYIPIDTKEDFTQEETIFVESLSNAEESYIYLIKCGWQPQQAREILPLCTKSELVMTGFESDWKEFLDKRLYETTGKVHPDMKELAQMIETKLFDNKK